MKTRKSTDNYTMSIDQKYSENRVSGSFDNSDVIIQEQKKKL